jgi:hypothetical protein
LPEYKKIEGRGKRKDRCARKREGNTRRKKE